MEIQSQDYQGPERRNNGKLRLSMGDSIKVVTLIITLLVGGVAAWINLNNSVCAIAEDAEELEETHNKDVSDINGNLKVLVGLVQAQAVQNGVIQTTLDHIKDDIKEIKENGQ